MKRFLIAAVLAAMTLGAAPAAVADPASAPGLAAPQDRWHDDRRDDRRMDRRDDRRWDRRDDRRWDRRDDRRWDRGRHNGWRNNCRNVRKHHRWVRVCYR